jgi:hypothetical protein
METSSMSALTLAEAHQLLKQFDCVTPADRPLPPQRDRLKQALLVVVEQSDYQMLGICAETIAAGKAALETYTQALGYQLDSEPTPIEGAVYIKFNTKTNSCYASSYEGEYRGVLVSCQSAYETGLNEMYGHLPLDLFAD